MLEADVICNIYNLEKKYQQLFTKKDNPKFRPGPKQRLD